MKKRYLIDVKQEIITPVTVKAGSKREAVECALRHEGDPGDSTPGDTIILTVRCLD